MPNRINLMIIDSACTWALTITITLCMNGHGEDDHHYLVSVLFPIISFSVLRPRSLSTPTPTSTPHPDIINPILRISISIGIGGLHPVHHRPNSESGTKLRPNLRPSIRGHQPANRTPTPDTPKQGNPSPLLYFKPSLFNVTPSQSLLSAM